MEKSEKWKHNIRIQQEAEETNVLRKLEYQSMKHIFGSFFQSCATYMS